MRFSCGRNPATPQPPLSSLLGFTLIELLIVVGIIGILAAIAVPNFLAAQIRAKVSRTEADLYALSVSLRMYKLDNNTFPPEDAPYQLFRTSHHLTTPIAYLSTLPLDTFSSVEPENPDYSPSVWRRFYYQNFVQVLGKFGGCGLDNSDSGNQQYGPWVLNGIGPDREYSGVLEYNPSNGLITTGDIIRSARSAKHQRKLE